MKVGKPCKYDQDPGGNLALLGNIILCLLIHVPILLFFFSGGKNNFVMMADPNQLENILRAEGKYPVRDTNMTPNMQWLTTKSKYPVGFGTK